MSGPDKWGDMPGEDGPHPMADKPFTSEEKEALLAIRDDMRKVREGLEDYLFRPTYRPPPKVLDSIPLDPDVDWLDRISGSPKSDLDPVIYWTWVGIALLMVAAIICWVILS